MAGIMRALMLIMNVIILGLGLALHIAALATTKWLVNNENSESSSDVVSVEMGLFQYCINSKCNEYPENSYTAKWTDRLVITGAVQAGIAFLLAIAYGISAIKQTFHKGMIYLSGGMGLLAGILIFIGAMMFSRRFDEIVKGSSELGSEMHYGFSFYSCVAAGVILILGSILILLVTRRLATFQIPQGQDQILVITVPSSHIKYQRLFNSDQVV